MTEKEVHSSLRKEEAKQEQTAEEEILQQDQSLATPEAQENLHSSQTKQHPVSSSNLSSTPGETKGEVL